MTAKELRAQIYNNLSLRETEDLVKIWQANDRTEMSDLAFEVIEEILRERLEEIPAQGEPVTEEIKREKEKAEREEQESRALTGQPAFYDPDTVLNMAGIADKMANAAIVIWGIIIIDQWLQPIISGYGFSQAGVIESLLIYTLSYALSGAVNYFLLRGISYGLKILMEFEFNTRGAE